ncbi:MAG: 50S ribosomal protein L30 [Acidobacteriota bacterium]|jgi:LSU ribosomal protein L30P|nr:50S ribosomal protein L30 [Acidobacteriota bacterium]OQB56050.1 MAG: 50S ribosomal protein L30 [Candidatus Aminicenantes bacterium ADurb.Bin147]HNQ79528.1 50S ribosomal protein L30 [Candidatus Aminicenantes bacterium]MDD8010124.1 50S ribosomal protein L30 [Acidobacteriota bacterium]MDD8029735.1 50S ribosomal protein L30 [Acidobacteriota bacterium]
MKAAASKKIKITLVRSLISRPESQRKVARGLGLGRLKSSVVREDTPSIRGMIRKINHVVKVEGVE